ncbi:AcrR family transcriptional regulator [Kineococcus radiotolerans]|uniref:AcrR family transcriptional regulator n=1 Tax=Kineococcus radiotolerans TaxID=131568 RepID=A0A7W4TK60_KINRA|nr:TetR/AcrR family transcriptional regulator [Kineococcus radiotolerans]MBB2900414.1 AcrR family transcriptional regulator [Kineococcus radiotolerans]
MSSGVARREPGAAGTGRVGRPRTRAGAGSGRTPRQEILDAAAALFGESGYAATSTRAIAERVGIRQASLYYHFAGKDEILRELLEASVRPTLDVADALRSAAADPAAALHALVVVDVGTLLAGPLGVAALYVAPEVRQPRFEVFRDHRRRLLAVYADLAADLVPTGHPVEPAVLGHACLHLVEMAPSLPPTPGLAAQVAAACLGAVGVTGERAAAAARDGDRVRRAVVPPGA